jgi:hypothetical protein
MLIEDRFAVIQLGLRARSATDRDVFRGLHLNIYGRSGREHDEVDVWTVGSEQHIRDVNDQIAVILDSAARFSFWPPRLLDSGF